MIYFQTSEEGAQTSIYLAVSEDVAKTNGKYFKDCKVNMILIRQNIIFYLVAHVQLSMKKCTLEKIGV